MSGRAAPRWLGALARLCLLLYPSTFRREAGTDFVEAAAHRWSRERARSGALAAAFDTVRVLAADTVRAAPAAHALERKRLSGRGSRGRVRGWVDGAAADARVAARTLVKRPGFAALVVGTLGLGLGANAALFGALDRVVLRPLPFADGERMVHLSIRDPRRGWDFVPSENAVARWRSGARTLEWVETYVPGSAVWTGGRPAQLLATTEVSAGLPAALGVRAVVGRVPSRSDLDSSDPPLVMLSEELWRREFGADAGVVGRVLVLNDTLFTVAGVWPAAARLELRRAPDLWRVLAADAIDETRFGYVLALVRPGVGIAALEAELDALVAGLESVPEGFAPVVTPPHGFLGEAYVQGLWLVFAGATLLLLASLANTVNLLLNRTVSRTGELGVRAALGGSMPALARQFMIEGLALTLLGVAAAALVARWGGAALAAILPERIPALAGSGASSRAIAYAGLLATGAAVVCAVAPLTQLRHLDIRALLSGADGGRSGGGRTGWARKLTVAVQVGLAVVLVTGAALTFRSFQKLRTVDTGMDVERLVQFALRLPDARYGTAAARRAYWDRVRDAVASLPGVEGVTSSGNPLFGFAVHSGVAHLEGEAAADRAGFSHATGVRPGFFSVVGIPQLEGRDFDRDAGDNAVIVNRTFARMHGGTVLGRRLTFDDSTFYRIVGVVDDVAAGSLAEGTGRAQLYLPDAVQQSDYERFIVRTSGDASALLALIRTRIAELDPDLPFREAATGPDIVRRQTARHRFVAQLLAVFGVLALLLAVTGVYGVVALDVSRRTREVGIRVVLGAGVRRIVRDVVTAGLRPVLAGVACGAAAAVLAVRFIEGLLFRVPAVDPASLAAGVIVLLVTTALACWVPARRASRIDPARALRAE